MSHATPPPAPTPDDLALNTNDPSNLDDLSAPDSLPPVTSTSGPHQSPEKLGRETNTTGPHQGV